jgi:hypothetical protein
LEKAMTKRVGVLAVAGGAISIVLVAFIVESVASPRAETAPSVTRAPTAKPTVPTEVYMNAPPSASPSTTVYMDWSAAEVTSASTRPRGSVFSQASALATHGDAAGARALLEPRVFGSGRATDDEVNLLRGLCKAQHDKHCVAAIAAKYPR